MKTIPVKVIQSEEGPINSVEDNALFEEYSKSAVCIACDGVNYTFYDSENEKNPSLIDRIKTFLGKISGG